MRIEHTVSNYARDLELKEMNKNMVGEPFHHPDTFLLLLGCAKVYFHLSYWQTKEGIAQGHARGKAPPIPDYSTISSRINRLDIKTKDDKSREFEGDYIVVAIDRTGIKITKSPVDEGKMEYKKEILKNPHTSKRQEPETSLHEGNR